MIASGLAHPSYDPTTGTFLSPDPLTQGPDSPELTTGIGPFDGQPTVANPYHYVSNDPLNWVDPLGLCRTTDVLFDTSTNVDSEDAFVVGGPEGGLSYDECNNRDDVLCISQDFDPDLGEFGVAPVKCGPHEYSGCVVANPNGSCWGAGAIAHGADVIGACLMDPITCLDNGKTFLGGVVIAGVGVAVIYGGVLACSTVVGCVVGIWLFPAGGAAIYLGANYYAELLNGDCSHIIHELEAPWREPSGHHESPEAEGCDLLRPDDYEPEGSHPGGH